MGQTNSAVALVGLFQLGQLKFRIVDPVGNMMRVLQQERLEFGVMFELGDFATYRVVVVSFLRILSTMMLFLRAMHSSSWWASSSCDISLFLFAIRMSMSVSRCTIDSFGSLARVVFLLLLLLSSDWLNRARDRSLSSNLL